MSKNGASHNWFMIILCTIVALVALLIIGFVVAINLLGSGVQKAGDYLTKRNNTTWQDTQNKFDGINLPADLTYVSKVHTGDGVDSVPGWNYSYTTKDSPEQIAQILKDNLEKQGFVLDSSLKDISNDFFYNKYIDLELLLSYKQTGLVNIQAPEKNW